MTDGHEGRLDKYLTDGERIVVATHRHWFAIVEPLATVTLTLLLIGIAFTAGAPSQLVEMLLVGWLIVFGRAIVRVWEWNLEWFVATDQRLLLVYGFIIRKVDMLPMSKVTDMTFRRSILGRVFGYGTFVLESAGQDQALSDLHYIPDPNETYLKIVATIFKTGDEDEIAEEEELGEIRHDLTEGRPTHEPHDPWDEDPTERHSLREDIAHLGRRRRRHRDDPDTVSMPAVNANPVGDRTRRRRLLRTPDYAETLYTSGDTQADPWDEDYHGPHRKKRRWWDA